MSAKSRVLFIREAGTQRWTVEISEFARFREVLGPDVLNAFSRCFVHADRLTSLVGFAYLSEQRYGMHSRPFTRDLQTMVWFVVGTLRELATAIRDLRSALAKRGALDANSAPWITLREVEKRWEDDPFYREMRNIVSFHVNPDVTEKGLQALAKRGRVVIIEGDGEPQQNLILRLGLESLSMGFDMDVNGFERLMMSVGKDQGVASTIQEAFLLALHKAGIPFVELPGGA
jgi:hypothetical protein